MAPLTKFLSQLLKVAIVMLAATGVSPATEALNEQQLTVAYLYNFLKFTEWPEGTVLNEVTLCVADSTAFDKDLDAISGRLAQNKTVQIKHIELGESPDECQLLFLPREENPIRIEEWVKNTANSPALTVSDVDGFLDLGGMVALVNDGSRLQFEVNLEPTRKAGLMLNSRLLKIAQNIRGK